jgi:hypothetical protein
MVMTKRFPLTLSRTINCREQLLSEQGSLERVLERVNGDLSCDHFKLRAWPASENTDWEGQWVLKPPVIFVG